MPDEQLTHREWRTNVQVNLSIPIALRRLLKSEAAARDTTMQRLVSEALTERFYPERAKLGKKAAK